MSDTRGPTLRQLLRGRGISDREIERTCGVHRSVLRGYEAGRQSRPAYSVCSRIAALLGVDVLVVLDAAAESIRRGRGAATVVAGRASS